MEETGIISCQLSYLPINSDNYVDEVDEVLAIITKAFPDAKVGEMSTFLRGPYSKVQALITELIKFSIGNGNRFHLKFDVSNYCGC